MHPYSVQTNVNIYLAPPSHPPRRKSLAFLLLLITALATVAVFVLLISRLGREIKANTLQIGGEFKILYVWL